ncbi:RsmB/NOP family class I SAM-dependent RNA methyltransferase [Halocynthiibacter namhaensis]|uniref:RsmB/NOP family class I SAM-dependent RNA methyltransferase n=1 Tax=Halocynthiibacter namhaensis TaxID=1290553 RepID=UPI0005795946|nr:RsmB/NOP family class I SAM-dependent RNA methyltransferase [Halocynthiibacter namhaensis]
MAEQGLAARQAAAALLRGVIIDGRLLSELPAPKFADPADLARAQRLAISTLRWVDRADRLLGRYLRKMPAPEAMVLLRLGTVEICVENGAGHGVVNAMVSLAQKHNDTRHFKGLINGTLRKVAAEGPEKWDSLPTPQLPKWLRKPLIADYTKPVIAQMEAVQATLPPLDLTPKDGNSAALAERLGGEVMPGGSVRLRAFAQVSKMDGFAEGDWWVQDMAAALPVQLLQLKPGEKALDLCAAPGGKTMQMAALGADVTALDLSEKRMARVQENLDRTGLKANLVTGDALEHQGQYDAILLDAPCSATGTMRRHPDLPRAKDGSEFPDLFALQEKMIDHAVTLLAPGGRLVFCTCSLLPDEGEIQIEDALARNEGLEVVPVDLPNLPSDWRSAEGGLRLRPDFLADQGGMDGFYMAVLRKA